MTLHPVSSGQAHTTGLHVDDVGRDVLSLTARDGSDHAFVDALADLLIWRAHDYPDGSLRKLFTGCTIRFTSHDGVPTLHATFPK